MKKKLYVAFASIAAASLVLTSCSSSDDTAATDTASESAATEEAEATEEAAAGDAGTAVSFCQTASLQIDGKTRIVRQFKTLLKQQVSQQTSRMLRAIQPSTSPSETKCSQVGVA